MDIVKIRVPWRDDLMNVKILFSCWPKYLYTHIWPQNIEKWGKTVILLVKWWISNFRPPSGEPFFRCLRHRGFAKLYPLNRTHVFRKNQRWTPLDEDTVSTVRVEIWKENIFFIFLSFCQTFFYFLFSFLWHFQPLPHIFSNKKVDNNNNSYRHLR